MLDLRIWTLLVLIAVLKTAGSSNVLMVTMCGTRSHTVPFVALSKALVQRGHNVTLLSGFPGAAVEGGATELSPDSMVTYIRDFHMIDFIGHRFHGTHAIPPSQLFRYGLELCQTMLDDPEFIAFNRSDVNFDVLIIDSTYSSCAIGLSHRFRAPVMWLNAVAFYSAALSDSGNPVPYAIAPSMLTGFSENMNMFQRGWNAVCHFLERAGNYVLAQVFLQPMLRKAFGQDMPRIIDMQRNVSFILQNAHPLLTYPQPLLPNVAEIGCIHCRKAKPLPKDLDDWVSGAGSRGVIIVSMGSMTREGQMPAELRSMLQQTLAKLPHRVIWKWTGNDTTGGYPEPPPPNVKVVSWMPQQDLLGHPNVVALVSHGGLLSMYETAYHGKPAVMLPVFFDHDTNALKAQLDGYALKVDLRGLTSDTLLSAINTILNTPSYRASAEHRSRLLKDQPESPLDRAVYWTEHVIKHQGAPHLQSMAARDVGLIQYLYLDLLVVTALIIYLCRKLQYLSELIDFEKISDKIAETVNTLIVPEKIISEQKNVR